MSKEKSPAFQFYPKDFLVDEHVSVMTPEEVGAYVILLCHAWIENGLPNDLKTICRLSRCHPPHFKRIWLTLSQLFSFEKVDCPSRLFNRRMEEEREKQAIYRETQTKAGRMGSDKRWGRHSEPTGFANTTPMAKNSSPSPSPSSTTKLQEPPIIPPRGDAYESVLSDEPAIQHTRPHSEKAEINRWFEQTFWPAWPLKKGKEAARKAALKYLGKPEAREAAMKGLLSQFPEMVRKIRAGEPTKWAQGWISGKRWEDEAGSVIPITTTVSKHDQTMAAFDKAIERDYGSLFTQGH